VQLAIRVPGAGRPICRAKREAWKVFPEKTDASGRGAGNEAEPGVECPGWRVPRRHDECQAAGARGARALSGGDDQLLRKATAAQQRIHDELRDMCRTRGNGRHDDRRSES